MEQGTRSITPHSTADFSAMLKTVNTLLTVLGDQPVSADWTNDEFVHTILFALASRDNQPHAHAQPRRHVDRCISAENSCMLMLQRL